MRCELSGGLIVEDPALAQVLGLAPSYPWKWVKDSTFQIRLHNAVYSNSLQEIHYYTVQCFRNQLQPLDATMDHLVITDNDKIFKLIYRYIIPENAFRRILYLCAAIGSPKILQIILSDGFITVNDYGYHSATPKPRNSFGCNHTLIPLAIEHGCFISFEILLKDDRFSLLPQENPFFKRTGKSPIIEAIRHREYEITKLLSNDERMPLLTIEEGLKEAIKLGLFEMVEVLLQVKGIRINLGITFCAVYNQPEILRLLLSPGFEDHYDEEDLGDALVCGAMNGSKDIVQILLTSLKMRETFQNYRGMQTAFRNGFTELGNFLLEGEKEKKKFKIGIKKALKGTVVNYQIESFKSLIKSGFVKLGDIPLKPFHLTREMYLNSLWEIIFRNLACGLRDEGSLFWWFPVDLFIEMVSFLGFGGVFFESCPEKSFKAVGMMAIENEEWDEHECCSSAWD